MSSLAVKLISFRAVTQSFSFMLYETEYQRCVTKWNRILKYDDFYISVVVTSTANRLGLRAYSICARLWNLTLFVVIVIIVDPTYKFVQRHKMNTWWFQWINLYLMDVLQCFSVCNLRLHIFSFKFTHNLNHQQYSLNCIQL